MYLRYFIYIYEVKFLAYDVLWKVLNFPLNLLCWCDEWLLRACIRPSRGQVRHVTSRGCSPIVTALVISSSLSITYKMNRFWVCPTYLSTMITTSTYFTPNLWLVNHIDFDLLLSWWHVLEMNSHRVLYWCNLSWQSSDCINLQNSSSLLYDQFHSSAIPLRVYLVKFD